MSLVDAFVASLDEPPDLPAPAREHLERALQTVLDAARADLPEIPLPDEDVAAYLGTKLGGPVTTAEALGQCLASLPAADLLLALAAAHGNDAAIAVLEERYFPPARRALRRMSLAEADIVDVLQQVRKELFVADGARPPSIHRLAGGGNLSALIRLIATRRAINLRHATKEIAHEPGDLVDAVCGGRDPELTSIKELHAAEFREAFERAVAELSAAERNLLRLTLLHRLTIDDIAAMNGIHRATAARRIAKIRERLGRDARRHLRSSLKLSTADMNSLFRLVQSGLRVSFDRLLGPDDDTARDEPS